MADRMEYIDPERASAPQQAVIAQLGAGRGRIPTPFNIWLHNPGLAKGMETLGTHIDHSPVLSEAETEVAILSTAVFWDADYVIANHTRHALKAGLPESVVDAIVRKQRPTGIAGRLGLVLDAVAEILSGGRVDDARFTRYVEGIGRPEIAELLITVGYFTSVALAMNLHALEPKPKP
jgi:4-carboxymuconolactone decarboxylase